MILTCAKIQGKLVIFGEAGAPESYMNIKPAPFLSIRFILNNPRFSKWFKCKRHARFSNFCQISSIKVF